MGNFKTLGLITIVALLCDGFNLASAQTAQNDYSVIKASTSKMAVTRTVSLVKNAPTISVRRVVETVPNSYSTQHSAVKRTAIYAKAQADRNHKVYNDLSKRTRTPVFFETASRSAR